MRLHAQKKVETHNFEIRKHLLEYDNTMNEQRQVVYSTPRREILGDDGNLELVKEMVEDVTLGFIERYRPEAKTPVDQWNWEELNKGFKSLFNTDSDLSLERCTKEFDLDLETYLIKTATNILDDKFSQYDDEQVSIALRDSSFNNGPALERSPSFNGPYEGRD